MGMTPTFPDWHAAGIDTADVIELPLTKGYTAIIDADDAERIGPLKWQAHVVRRSKTVYASRATTQEERAQGWPARVLLHRLIAGDPNGPMLDHINGNGLDCRKQNIRPADYSLNGRNVDVKSASGRIGVGFDKSRGKWRAYGKHGGKAVTIGRFDTKAEAIKAREAWERENFAGIAFRWSIDHGC